MYNFPKIPSRAALAYWFKAAETLLLISLPTPYCYGCALYETWISTILQAQGLYKNLILLHNKHYLQVKHFQQFSGASESFPALIQNIISNSVVAMH